MRWERLQEHHWRQGQGGGEGEVGGEISGPGKRWGHTCNAIKEGRFLYVFGGYGRDNCQTNQVHVFDAGGSSIKLYTYVCVCIYIYIYFFFFPPMIHFLNFYLDFGQSWFGILGFFFFWIYRLKLSCISVYVYNVDWFL